MPPTNDLEKVGNKIIVTLLVSQSLFSASLILVFTVASIIVVDLAGGNSQWTGAPSTIQLVSAALVAYPVGWLMDRAGRRIGLSLGHLFGLAGAAVAGWAVVQQSLPVFLAGMFTLGLSRGAVELGRYAAAEASRPERRGRAISLVVLGGTVGSVTGPSLIALSNNLGNRLNLPDSSGPWLMAGFLYVAALVVINLFLRPEPKVIAGQLAAGGPDRPGRDEKGRSFVETLQDPRSKLAVGAMMFSQLAMVVVMTVTPIHMHIQQHEIGSISLVIMAHTLGMFGLSFFTGWLVDKVGRIKMIVAGGLILAVACATAPLSDAVIWLAVALFLLGLGWNFGFVAGSTLLDDLLRPHEKGRVQGAADALVKLASGAGSLSSGLIFAATGFALTSWLTIMATVIPIALVLLWRVADRSVAVGRTVSG